MKWIIRTALAVVLALLLVWQLLLPGLIERRMNLVSEHRPYVVTAEARALHGTIPVADLHADSLLWSRDLTERSARGHTDLPRLVEGGVALQVLTAVTKSPSGQNYERNEATSDMITVLAIAQSWPTRTWNSLYERAAYQARKLADLERRSEGGLVFVRTRDDLRGVLEARAKGTPVVAGIFGIEGSHPLEGELDNLDQLFGLGLRVVGLTHFFDNRLGGSLHGTSGEGLTDFGRNVVARAAERRMIIDIAHASPRAVRDVLAMSDRPVILSHGGFKGICDTARNLDDALMQEIAAAGGLIGVGFWDGAVCDFSLEGVAAAIRYGIDLVGVDHIALGSDYDGATEVLFDSSEQPALTQALMDAGLDETSIRKVMGENAVRFFLENLP
jgi:microsomal dipeptidase-like Zn-dependent dipeptidase